MLNIQTRYTTSQLNRLDTNHLKKLQNILYKTIKQYKFSEETSPLQEDLAWIQREAQNRIVEI